MKKQAIRAEVKFYPAFADEDGVMMRVRCTGHTIGDDGLPLYSHWQLWECVGGKWRFAASTRLTGYAQAQHARARLV